MFVTHRLLGANQLGRPTAWGLVSTTTSSVEAGLSAPTDVRGGDVLAFAQVCSGLNSNIPTSAVPSGFTLAISTTQSFVNVFGRQNISYKLATGAEKGTTLQGMVPPAGYENYQMLLVFRGANKATAVTHVGAGGNSFYNTSGTYSQTIVAGTLPNIALGFQSLNTLGSVVLSGADQTAFVLAFKYGYDVQEASAVSNTYSGSYNTTGGPFSVFFNQLRLNITQ